VLCLFGFLIIYTITSVMTQIYREVLILNDIRQRFRNDFKSGKGSKVILAILCAAVLIMLTIWTVMRLGLLQGSAARFDPVSPEQEGKYVSLEVVGVDDWAANRDDEYYYVVQGSDMYLYLVRMPEEDFDSMQKQYDYWLSVTSDDADAEPVEPVPVEITGYSTAFPDELLKTVAETYGYSEEEMANSIGSYYLDANTELRGKDMLYLPVGAGVCAVLALLVWLNGRQKKKNIEKALDALEQKGQLQAAWDEWNSYQYDDPKETVAMTEHYIFDKNSSEIIPYQDIAWAYKFVIRRRFTEVNSYIVCKMNDGTTRQVTPVRNRKEAVERILAVIAEKKPGVLIGYSKENKNAYKEMTKM